MSNNINTMQIQCYINYHWNNTKIKSIQSKLFQCIFYTSKALNLGHLVKVLLKYLNSTNRKGSPLCDGDHEGNDEDSLFKHKHYKIQQTPSHTSKVVATNNLKTLTPWSCWIQNGLQPKHCAYLIKLEIT